MWHVDPWIKMENLVGTTTGLQHSYVGELVFGVNAGVNVTKQIEPGVRVWANAPFSGADFTTVAVVEPQVRMHFGEITPVIGAILPFRRSAHEPVRPRRAARSQRSFLTRLARAAPLARRACAGARRRVCACTLLAMRCRLALAFSLAMLVGCGGAPQRTGGARAFRGRGRFRRRIPRRERRRISGSGARSPPSRPIRGAPSGRTAWPGSRRGRWRAPRLGSRCARGPAVSQRSSAGSSWRGRGS